MDFSNIMKDHSYEEIRSVAIHVLRNGSTPSDRPTQYNTLMGDIAFEFKLREMRDVNLQRNAQLSQHDREVFLEVFWDLFRQGIITLGYNDTNNNFPFYRVSENGKRILQGQEPYFFHDISSYEKVIKESIPNIDSVTLLYLKEGMQAFLSGCTLSSTVMIGVSTEHSFLKLLECIESNPSHSSYYANVFTQKTILQKFTKFISLLEQNSKSLPREIKEDLDTNLSGILSMIRNFRNESGHPSGNLISREQTYILLHLFISCCKKIYQLIEYFKK